MKHWIVTHANGDQRRYYTNGDDPAAEGIDTGVWCEEGPEPDHELQAYSRHEKRWKDCPKKKAAHEHAQRRALSHAELVERLLALEERVASLAEQAPRERRKPIPTMKEG